MAQEFYKDPNEVLDYMFDWSTWLDGDTISSATAISAPTGITKNSQSNTTTTVTIWLSGGTAGNAYDFTSEIVTAAGRTAQRTITVVVKNL